ncbi:MAG: VOC family protein [Phycisphaerae bacterium]|nr:VOC family protein [Phycisphaerae bacterium]
MFRGGLPSDLDHLLVAVPVLDRAIDEFARALGVRPESGGRHAEWGTHNALLSLGSRRYLEIMSLDPAAPEAARTKGEAAFGFSRGAAPRVIGWCAAASDLEARRRAALDAGVDLGDAISGARDRPDGSKVRWRITPPIFHGDGMVPFFIDWGETRHPSLDAPTGCRLLRLEGEHPDPERIWRMLSAVGSQLSVSRGPRARLLATLEGPTGSFTVAGAAP